MHYKKLLKSGFAVCLAMSMLTTNNVANAAISLNEKKQAEQAKEEEAEQLLREMIRDGAKMEEDYPNGLFNFIGTQYSVKEDEDYIEIGIMRQGGTKGTATVEFKAIDITTQYGADYKIYQSKKKNKPMKKGEDAFPLIKTAYEDDTDISQVSGEEVVDQAVQSTDGQDEKGKKEKDPLDKFPDAQTATTVSAGNVVEGATSLMASKEEATGQESDRKDWKMVADGSGEETAVRENYDLFLDSVGGSDVTLTFEDGEYVKYLYLFPEDDKEAEAEEQVLLALLQNDENAPVGDSYNAYVNIKDNEEKEELAYQFKNVEVTAKGDKAAVTIERTSGTGYYSTLYVGTAEGSANADADYVAGTQAIHFYAGQTEHTVYVDILENEYRELDRDFYIVMSKDGENYLGSKCHVTIPGEGKGVASAQAASDASGDKISKNGYASAKGQWVLKSTDFNVNKSFYRSGDNLVAKHTGGDTEVTSTCKLYGVEKVSYSVTNVGAGIDRSWWEAYYKNFWHRIIRKKSYRYHEDIRKDYNVYPIFNSTAMNNGKVSGEHKTAVNKTVTVGAAKQAAGALKFHSHADGGNATNATVRNVVLHLKAYGYKTVPCATKFYTYDYTPNGNKLTKQENTKREAKTPELTLASVKSNVKNAGSGNNVKNTKVYRSDTLVFSTGSYNTTQFTFKGIEISADGKNWISASNNNTVVLNQALLEKLGDASYTTSELKFRPKFQQNTASAKFVLENSVKGVYNNVTKDTTYKGLHVGDRIVGIEGKKGTVAAYQPTFTYRKASNTAFVKAGNNQSLTLDPSNSEGAVAQLSIDSLYQEVCLSYSDPKVTVQANPSEYRNTFTNLMIKVDNTSYDMSKTADVEKLQNYFEQNVFSKDSEGNPTNDTNYKADPQVTVSFEYMYNPKYKNGKGDQQTDFGVPQYANLNVYDGEVEPKFKYKLIPTTSVRNGQTIYSFAQSGKLSDLKWTENMSASIQIFGQKKVTSRETVIDFLGTSANYVKVTDLSKNDIKDTKGNVYGNPFLDLLYEDILNPLENYLFTAITNEDYETVWGDYSLDINSDGNVVNDSKFKEIEAGKERLKALGQDESLAEGSTKIFYGNIFNYKPSIFNDTKIYYSFKKKDTVNQNNSVEVDLYNETSTVLEPDKRDPEPLVGARVLFGGTELATELENGQYMAWGNYQAGVNYVTDIEYQGIHMQVAAVGTGIVEETVSTTDIMFPVEFSLSHAKKGDKEATPIVETNGNSSFVTIDNVEETTKFKFRSSDGVQPNKAIVTIYDRTGVSIVQETVTKTEDGYFTFVTNPAKAGVKPGCGMKIQGVYNDGTKDYVYPEVEVGLVYRSKLTAISIAASFKTALSEPLKMFGNISTKFDLPLDYSLDKDNKNVTSTEYKVDNTIPVETLQIAFGYNDEVLKKLKQQQIEYRADHKGTAMSGRDNVKKYLESLMEDDDNEEDDSADEEEEKAKDAQDEEDTKSNKDTDSSFEFNFSVALILTVETGIDFKNKKSDGMNYFDSMALIAAGEASAEQTVVYTTPIGVDLLLTLSAGGKAVVAFGVESQNDSKYADIFNLTKNGADKEQFKLDKKYFSIYTKFVLAPELGIEAGVGLGGGKIAKLTVWGKANFDFGFTEPLLGTNTSSEGYGNMTVSCGMNIKILFIKKSWTFYKSKEISLFNYGAKSVEEMLEEFNDNYLYDTVDEDYMVLASDYLENRSEWQPYDVSAKEVNAGQEVILEEGVYANTDTKVVKLSDGSYLMVYLDDVVGEDGKPERNEYNRSQILLTTSKDQGATWSKPVQIDKDGTWDETPNVFVVTDDKALITWSDASAVYTAEGKVADDLSALDISGAWYDVSEGKCGEPFAITSETGEEKYQDAAPMVAYDETTKQLMVYYTKTDYSDEAYKHNEDAGKDLEDESKTEEEIKTEKEDAITYGDLVNGYSLVAVRKADLTKVTDDASWNSAELWEQEGYLDLAVPVTISEKEQEVKTGETVSYTDLDGTEKTEEVVQTKYVRDIVTENGAITDPRVVDSQVISYNGLALYAYTMDFDQSLNTTDDQQLYVQIYNFMTNEFHHPIQITSDKNGNSNPQFVRCKNMTYLYWINGGDIKYLNITQLVKGMQSEDSEGSLQLKKVEYTDVNGNAQSADFYILNRFDNDPIQTAITHPTETDEDGNVIENKITEFNVESNGTSMFVAWTNFLTSTEKDAKTGEEKVVRENQVFGAYCEPKIELKEDGSPYAFDNTDEVEFTFVEGKDNTTYPVSATIKTDIPDSSYKAGDVYTYDYTKDYDVNGEVGKVKAGDEVVKYDDIIASCDGSDWSTPIQITRESKANYQSFSFLVTADNEIHATFTRGEQKVNADGSETVDESNLTLATQKFVINSTLETSDVMLQTTEETEEVKEEESVVTTENVQETGICQPNEKVTFAVEVTNDGLKPLDDITYCTYATKNGEVIADSKSEWSPLAPTDVVENGEETTVVNQFLGGNTIQVTGEATMNDTIAGTELVVEFKDADGKVLKKVTKKLEEKPDVKVDVEKADLVAEDTAQLDVKVSNTGNAEHTGPVEVVYDGKVLTSVENVVLAPDSSTAAAITVDLSDCQYSDMVTQEEGSKKDAIALTVSCAGITADTEVVRETTAAAGLAFDAIKKIVINAKDATDSNAEAIAVTDTLTIPENQVMSLQSVFEVDSESAPYKKLAEAGLSAEAQMSTEWTTSDASIAVVDNNGLLVPMKPGTVEITAITYPGVCQQKGIVSVATGTEQEDGTLTMNEASTGSYELENVKYKIPASLVQKKKFTLVITEVAETETTDAPATEVPTDTPATEVPTDIPAPATVVPSITAETPAPTASVIVTNAPQGAEPATNGAVVTQAPTDTTTVTDTTGNKKKSISKLSVKVSKDKKKVTVQTLKSSKVVVKVYKTKALAKKGKKKGCMKTYTIKANKNKTGKVVIKLKKKLGKKHALRVTVSKSGYKNKTVVK